MFNQYLAHLHGDFHKNKESTKNLANSTMKKKNFVPIVGFVERTKPPINFVIVIFLWGQMVGMIFVRKSIHLATKIFGSTNFNHSTAELFISYKSVMDTLEVLLLALLLELVGDVVFLVSRLFTVSVSVRSSFLYIVVRNGKEVHRVLDEFLIHLSSFSQEVPARAVDDANVPI